MFLKIFSGASAECKSAQKKTPLEKSHSASTSENSATSTEEISQSHIPVLTTRRHSLSNPFPVNALIDDSIVNDSFNQSFDPFDQQTLKRSKSFAYGFKEAPKKCCKEVPGKSVHFEADIVSNSLEQAAFENSSLYSGSSKDDGVSGEVPDPSNAANGASQPPQQNFDAIRNWNCGQSFHDAEVFAGFCDMGIAPTSSSQEEVTSSLTFKEAAYRSAPDSTGANVGSSKPLFDCSTQTMDVSGNLQPSEHLQEIFKFICSLDPSQNYTSEACKDQHDMLQTMTTIIENLNSICPNSHDKEISCLQCDLKRSEDPERFETDMTQFSKHRLVDMLMKERKNCSEGKESIERLEKKLHSQEESTWKLKQELAASTMQWEDEKASFVESQERQRSELRALASEIANQQKSEVDSISLSTDNEKLQRENQELQKQLALTQEENSNLERSLFEKKQVILLTNSGLDAAIEEKAQLTSQLTAKISILQDFNAIKAAEVSKLETRCAQLESKSREYQEDITAREEKHSSLLREMEGMAQSNKSLVEQDAHMKEELRMARASAKQKLEASLDFEQALNQTISNYEAKLKDAEFQIKEEKAQKEDAQSGLQKSQQENKDMSSRLKTLTSVLEESDETLRQIIEDTNQEKEKLEQEFQDQKNLIKELQLKVTDKSEQLKKSERHVGELKKSLEDETKAHESTIAALRSSNEIVSGSLKRLVKNILEALSPVLQEKYTVEITQMYYKFVETTLFTEGDLSNLRNIVQLLSISVSHSLEQHRDVEKQLEFEISDKQRYFESLLEKYTSLVIALHKDSGNRSHKQPLKAVK